MSDFTEYSEFIHSKEFRDALKVTLFNTVFDPYTKSVLCQGVSGHGFQPIEFKTKKDAWDWIEKGTIANLQEGLSNLRVMFIKMTAVTLQDLKDAH